MSAGLFGKLAVEGGYALGDPEPDPELVAVERLGQVVVGPGLHAAKHMLGVLERGKEHEVRVGRIFQLANAPGPPVSQTLVVRVKGVETIVQLPRDPARARALVIEVDPLEEGTNAR